MNKQINTGVGIAIIVIIATIFGGIIYFDNRKKEEDQTSAVVQKFQQSILPKQQTPQSSITNKSTDWRRYRDEKYGFEFSYPPDWEIKMGIIGVADDEGEIDYSLDEGSVFYVKPKTAEDSIKLQSEKYEYDYIYYSPSLSFSINPTTEKDVNKYVKKYDLGVDQDYPLIKEPTSLGGIPALKLYNCIKLLGGGAGIMDEANTQEFVAIKNGYVFNIQMPYLCKSHETGRGPNSSTNLFDLFEKQFNDVDKQYHQTFNQIISTFKFIK